MMHPKVKKKKKTPLQLVFATWNEKLFWVYIVKSDTLFLNLFILKNIPLALFSSIELAWYFIQLIHNIFMSTCQHNEYFYLFPFFCQPNIQCRFRYLNLLFRLIIAFSAYEIYYVIFHNKSDEFKIY